MHFIGGLPDLSHSKIIVVGDIFVDKYWYGPANRISPEAPVPVVKIKNEEQRLGGAGNVACNLSALGCDVTLMGFVGKDFAGEFIFDELKRKKIKSQIIIDKNIKTITKLRILSKNMQLIRLDFEELIPNIYQKILLQKFNKIINNFDLAIFSDYAKGTLLNINELIKVCNHLNIPTIVDPKQENIDIYKGATFLKPNFIEFQCMVGKVKNKKELEEKASNLIKKLNLKALVITKGSEGIFLYQKGKKVFEQKSCSSEVYDVTGAGDTVIAILGAFLACGIGIEKAIYFANKAAGIVVGKLGTSCVNIDDLNDINIVSSKFFTNKHLEQIIKGKKEKKQKIVMTNGCFDIIHAGHINYLKKAKELGDVLIIALNTDLSIKKIKGDKRPINNLENRIEVLSALEFVDYIVSFNEETPLKIIQLIKPDILVKGADYNIKDIAGSDFIIKNGGRVELIDLKKNLSTSKLINKLKNI